MLAQLGEELGLDKGVVKEVLNSNQFAEQVKRDIEAAQVFNISGVPHFMIDNKFYISGAKDVQSFLNILRQSWNARAICSDNVEATDFLGTSCNVTGQCD